MPARSTDARGGGRGDPADPRRATATLERLAAPDALAAPAPRRPARPGAPPTGSARCGSPSWPSATASSACAPAWRRSSPTPSAAPAPPWPSCPTAPTRAEDVLEDDAGGEPHDVALRVEATIHGDRLVLDFSGTDAQVDGNLNCPLSVTKSAAFFAVRVLTDPDAPPSAGAYRPIEVIAPRGLPAQRPLPGRGRRRQRRDLEPRRRPRRSPPWRRPAGARPGPGDDEQPDARRRGLHLLRDARRRPGRLPGRRRAERDPRRDVEHAQHPGRGAGDRVPAAGARAVAAPRQRRRRARTAAATGSCARSKRWRRCATR